MGSGGAKSSQGFSCWTLAFFIFSHNCYSIFSHIFAVSENCVPAIMTSYYTVSKAARKSETYIWPDALNLFEK